MKHKNSIVRVKTIYRNESGDYYENKLMTFEKYVSKKEYTFYGEKTEIHPYKWYELNKFYEIPSYWILLKLFRNNEHKISKNKHKTMSVIVLIIEILSIIKFFIEIISYLF